MKRNTRLFSLLLAASLASCALASCGEAAGVPAETASQPSETALQNAETEEPVIQRAPLGLPDGLDFNGETFHALTYANAIAEYYFFSDGENGDIMNDAIYRRRLAVEERLNVRLAHTLYGQNDYPKVPQTIKTMVQAGEDEFQQAYLHCIQGIASLVSGGYLYDLNTMPNIDMNAEWWNREMTNALNFGSNVYYGVNDFSIPNLNIVYFNKKMVTDLDLDNPYQLVDDGKWTIGSFLAMAKEVVQDVDGNGKMEKDVDRFAISTNEISKFISFVTGSEQYMTTMDKNNRIALAMNTEKMQKLVDQFADLALGNGIFVAGANEVDKQLTIQTDRTLFFLEKQAYLEYMRDYTVDFGFVPYPKYDEAQEHYRSMDWGSLMAVPTTVTNPDMVGAVIEALAYESADTVRPVYFNVVLTDKLSRDEDAVRMLDLILNSVCYEPAGNYFGFDAGFSDLFYALPRVAVESKKTDFASWYAKNEKSANKTIDKFYEELEKLEN